jgi:hypothetical protein
MDGANNEHHESTWNYFSSLWSALKLNFTQWQHRAVSRRLARTAADIETFSVHIE